RRPLVRGRGGSRARRQARQGRRRRDRAQPSGPGAKIPRVSASLSTHVLDTGQGRPAKGVEVELWNDREHVATGTTDEDGRVGGLAADLDAGSYRLVFHRASPFFTRVELEIQLGEGHFHVPLLVSPYSCTVYRGS